MKGKLLLTPWKKTGPTSITGIIKIIPTTKAGIKVVGAQPSEASRSLPLATPAVARGRAWLLVDLTRSRRSQER